MGPNVWSQGIARKMLSGGKSMNPTLAATALLGRKRVKRAGGFLRRVRRRSHHGNPLPAVVGSVLGGLGGLGGRFKTPSEKRAGGVAQEMVSMAVAGNLTAAKAIAERTEFGIQKERAVWRKAFAQVPKEIVALLARFNERVPGVDHSSPESALETARSRAFDVRAIQAEEKVGAAARGRAAEAKAERREALLAGVAQTGLQALAGRARRPTTRRRRSRGRRLSL